MTGDMSPNTARLLSAARELDYFGYAGILRDIHQGGRERVDCVIGQLACLVVEALKQLLDGDEDLDHVLARWLCEAMNAPDDEVTDAALTAFFDNETGTSDE
jgi:hypothetical protein